MDTKKRVRKYIKEWEQKCYTDGIPDEAPNDLEANDLVPSYKRICKALLKNDIALVSIGFQKDITDAYRIIKRVEIENRKTNNQLKLFQ